jgi:hypothetical protein
MGPRGRFLLNTEAVSLNIAQKCHGHLRGYSLSYEDPAQQLVPPLLMILALFAVLAAVVVMSLGV